MSVGPCASLMMSAGLAYLTLAEHAPSRQILVDQLFGNMFQGA